MGKFGILLYDLKVLNVRLWTLLIFPPVLIRIFIPWHLVNVQDVISQFLKACINILLQGIYSGQDRNNTDDPYADPSKGKETSEFIGRQLLESLHNTFIYEFEKHLRQN